MKLLFRLAGSGLALMGLAHFVAPRAFEIPTALVFPDDTRRWVYRNGMTELALGVAVAAKPTRVPGIVGVLAYGAWLGAHTATAAWRLVRKVVNGHGSRG